MKTLILLRHAKAEPAELKANDMDREVLEEGIQETFKAANYLLKNSITPQQIITSPAVRAYKTAEIIVEHLNLTKNIIIDEKLYNQQLEKYFEAIYSIDDKIDYLMLVGHNPIITNFANYFLSEQPIEKFLPSGIIVLEFNVTKWTEITSTKPKILHIFFP